MTTVEAGATAATADNFEEREYTMLLVISVTLNVCTLLYAIISRIFSAVWNNCCCKRSLYSDWDSSSEPLGPTCKESTASRRHLYNTLPSNVTELILSGATVVTGAYILTLSDFWNFPFVDKNVIATHNNAIPLLISTGLGRFAFVIGRLLLTSSGCSRGRRVPSWSAFRAVYSLVSTVCLLSVVITSKNAMIGAIVLLLEFSAFVEEATVVVAWIRNRLLDSVMIVIGVVSLVIHAMLPVSMLAVVSGRGQSPLILAPEQIGLLCFAIVFYTVSAIFILLQQLNRCLLRRRSRLDRSVETGSSSTNPAAIVHPTRKSKRFRRHLVGVWRPVIAGAIDGRRRVGGRGHFLIDRTVFRHLNLDCNVYRTVTSAAKNFTRSKTKRFATVDRQLMLQSV